LVPELNVLKDEAVLEEIGEWAAAETDVCIGAVGDCGSCTKFLAREVEPIEARGVPAIGLVVEGFELDWETNSRDLGRKLRYVTVPVRSETTDVERLRREMPPEEIETIEADLTRPLTDEERGPAAEAGVEGE
jgi:hypothetical protein